MSQSRHNLWYQTNPVTATDISSEEKILADLETKKQERIKVGNELQIELEQVDSQLRRLEPEILRAQEYKKKLEQQIVANRTIPCPELRDLLLAKINKTGKTILTGCKIELLYNPVHYVIHLTITTTSTQQHDLRSFLINHEIIDADLLSNNIDTIDESGGGLTYRIILRDLKSNEKKDTFAKVLTCLLKQESNEERIRLN